MKIGHEFEARFVNGVVEVVHMPSRKVMQATDDEMAAHAQDFARDADNLLNLRPTERGLRAIAAAVISRFEIPKPEPLPAPAVVQGERKWLDDGTGPAPYVTDAEWDFNIAGGNLVRLSFVENVRGVPHVRSAITCQTALLRVMVGMLAEQFAKADAAALAQTPGEVQPDADESAKPPTIN